MSSSPTRPFWRPASLGGAGLLPFLLLAMGLGSCGGSGGDYQDQELEDARTLGFPRGARVHRVSLGGRGAVEHAVPTRIQAAPGDGVEFRTVDHRVHTVSFLADSLAPEIHSYLERTGQELSMPLVSRGSRFILRLGDAPAGRYVFRSQGHGGYAYGVIEVGTSVPPDSVQGLQE